MAVTFLKLKLLKLPGPRTSSFDSSDPHCFTHLKQPCATEVTCVGLAKTIYIQCMYGNFGREITKFTVIYGVYIRFWPTLHVCETQVDVSQHFLHQELSVLPFNRNLAFEPRHTYSLYTCMFRKLCANHTGLVVCMLLHTCLLPHFLCGLPPTEIQGVCHACMWK